ncbi:MAG: O-antigen ligase family protein, partial [Acidobacteria bacterium]|nr:O-antigen ligase family protein [Acidobacteriota bacterium]MCA1651312.1 O-antigen ligase family protein [Acidobacteriota bacterium]
QHIVSSNPACGRRIAGALVTGAVVAGVLNLYRLIRAAGRSDTFWRTLAEYFGTVRLNEAFPDANAAGSFFIAALAVAIALASSAERAWRLLWITASAVIACGLWISGSRVAILAGLAAAAGAGMIALARKRIPVAALAAAAAVAVVGAVAVLYLPARGTQQSSSIATEVRGGMARVAVRMIADRPLTGIGLSEFYRRSGEYASPELLALFPRARNENAHNNFLQIGAELGIVGLAAFAWVLVTVLSTARHEGRQRLHTGLIIAVAAFLLTCLGGHPLLVHEAAYPFWILLGIAAAGPTPTETLEPSRGYRTVALAMAAAMLLSVPARATQQRRGADLEHVGIGVGTWQTAGDGTRFRWARGSAVLFVPGTYGGFKVRLSAAANSPVRVQLKLDNRIANVITVTPDGWRNVTVVLPPDRTGAMFRRLELTGTAEHGEDVQLMIGKVEPVGPPR